MFIESEAKLSESLQSVAIIGLGLIGASILKSIERYSPKTKRYGWSTGSELKQAQKSYLIESDHNLKDIVNLAYLIIIATPMDQINRVAKKIRKMKTTKKFLTVIEVGSVKKPLVETFRNLDAKKIEFVHTHPMGGSERTGYDAAQASIFREKPWLVLHDKTKRISHQSIERIDWLIKTTGSVRRDLPLEDHDKVVASISHFILNISHLAFDFVVTKHAEGLSVAGESFTTTTRLASDNPNMIHSINKQNNKVITEIINDFADFICQKDVANQPLEYFENNKLARDSWMHHRRKAG